jgi:thioredoxin reductase (NADPH)
VECGPAGDDDEALPMSAQRVRRPVILAVDDDPDVLAGVTRDLRFRFGDRYRIMRAASGAAALEVLADVRRRGEQVALLIADQRMPEMEGTNYLLRAREPGTTPPRADPTA